MHKLVQKMFGKYVLAYPIGIIFTVILNQLKYVKCRKYYWWLRKQGLAETTFQLHL
jgi:hypothetical protein